MSRPIVAADIWTAVMEAAGYRCQCTGGLCGSNHDGLGCPREFGTARLIAAPADLLLPPLAAARVPVSELRVWCLPCYSKAAATQRANERERARLEARDDPAPALFDI